MPSDLHNSTMADATGLIFSLFNIASAQEVPFAMTLYIHTMHQWRSQGGVDSADMHTPQNARQC